MITNKINHLIFYCLLIFSILFPCYLLLYSYPPGWSDDILLTPEDDNSRGGPDVDVDSFNNVWVVWDSAHWVNGTGEVLYSLRDSLGGCLIPETDVSNNASFSICPSIAVDVSNNVQFVWLDQTPLGLGLWHAKLANDGTVIIPPHMAVSGNDVDVPLPDIVLNKYQEINVVWAEMLYGYSQIDYTKLDSMGNPIIPKLKVSLDTFYAYWPGIGVDSFANNHLGYRCDSGIQDRFAYTKLDKNGNVLIDNKFFGTGCVPTFIADRSQNIHIVYGDPAGPGNSVKYLKLDQNGNVLIGPKTLSIHEDNDIPHMAMDSLQYLHVVWAFSNWVDTMGIMYTKLDTLGNFVIPPMPVVYWPIAIWPALARITVDKNNRLHLVWMDQRLDSANVEDIFYKRGENEQTIKELARLKAQNQPKISIAPNPFVNETKITFFLSQETKNFGIEIFDILGRKVKQFNNLTNHQSSYNQVLWDGIDENGKVLSNGIYFVVLENGKDRLTQKLILIR
ncbi:MAG: T9SS type A sorting domain-containing protein [bacterium]